MAVSKKPVRRRAAPRKRKTGLSGTRRVTRRRRRKTGMAGLNTGLLMGVLLGGAVAGFIDKPMSNFIENPMFRSGAKGALGAFLSTKSGIVQGIGLGMVAAAGNDLTQNLTSGMAGFPSLISGIPALIGENAFGNYSSAALADEFGEDLDDEDDDTMELNGYSSDALAGMGF